MNYHPQRQRNTLFSGTRLPYNYARDIFVHIVLVCFRKALPFGLEFRGKTKVWTKEKGS